MAVNAEYFDHPFHLDARGRTATTTPGDHVRDLIHQVLFTAPGERVNRPEFGCGLKQLVFLPNSDALATATQQMVQGALQRWLAELIIVERVEIQAEGASLVITVVYTPLATGERRADQFSHAMPV